MFLAMMIPGPKNPGKKLDVFLRLSIDKLNNLWFVGVETFNVYRKKNFQLKTTLMWTINDFLAYDILSSWSTHDNLSCPYYMEHNKAFRLKNRGKTIFFYCHRRFLPMNHPYRCQLDKFLSR
jgi:hypothetical protein